MVVLFQVHLFGLISFPYCHVLSHLFRVKNDFQHSVEGWLAIVGHHNISLELALDLVSFGSFVDVFPRIDSMDLVHDAVFSDNFSSCVYPEVNSFFAVHKRGSKTPEHFEVINCLSSVRVEEFSGSPNFTVFEF